jgi:hypothetical protein
VVKVEDRLKEERAEYGKQILPTLSAKLTSDYVIHNIQATIVAIIQMEMPLSAPVIV